MRDANQNWLPVVCGYVWSDVLGWIPASLASFLGDWC
jgi:hypothetical protein